MRGEMCKAENMLQMFEPIQSCHQCQKVFFFSKLLCINLSWNTVGHCDMS